jgi:uncharacterized SAM-binding protein YcdF (DUF218 family)
VPKAPDWRYVREMPLDAIVLLGCRIGEDARPYPAAERRALCAARAFHRGEAGLVIVSGGKRWGGVAEAEALANFLVAQGVPEQSLLCELKSNSTRENAWFVADLLRARDMRQVMVVTCDWHMRRALGHFRRAGLQVVGMPAVSPPQAWPARTFRFLRELVSGWVDRRAWSWSKP